MFPRYMHWESYKSPLCVTRRSCIALVKFTILVKFTECVGVLGLKRLKQMLELVLQAHILSHIMTQFSNRLLYILSAKGLLMAHLYIVCCLDGAGILPCSIESNSYSPLSLSVSWNADTTHAVQSLPMAKLCYIPASYVKTPVYYLMTYHCHSFILCRRPTLQYTHRLRHCHTVRFVGLN